MSEEEYFSAKAEFEKSFEDTYGVTFDRLRELAEAEREGRVAILPCKVGDTVYMVLSANARCTKYNAKCYKAIWIKWIDSHQEWRIVVRNENGWEIEVKFSDFGKTAFLNEAAALAAAARKGEQR